MGRKPKVMTPEQVEEIRTKDFFDCILPATIKFISDYYIVGDSYRCVWVIKEYPPSTEEQAILSQLADRNGVTLRIYHRLVDSVEQRKIIQNATRRNKLKSGGNDMNDTIEAEGNLMDVIDMLANLRKNRECLLHCTVFIECDPDLKETITSVRDRCKKLLAAKLAVFSESNERTLCDIRETESAVKGIVATVEAFDDAYAEIKHQRRLVDFSDLEHMTLDLLVGKQRDTFTSLSDELAARFREVMVDEYQDTNEVQDCIFNALTRKRQNCFMVGDVKQSIYQFRLADPGIFIHKYNTYCPAESAVDGIDRKVILSSNFRSSGGVVEAVNDVFSQYMCPKIGGLYYTEDEMLKEGIPHQPLSEPEVEFYAINVEHDRYTEEAIFVADRIKKLLDGKHMIREGEELRPITPEDIVILLRAPGSVASDYQNELATRGIRCVCEKSNDLLTTEEISVLRSLLQCISNPLQDIPLVAVLLSRVIGLSADQLASIRASDKQGCFYDALKASDHPDAIAFCDLLGNLRKMARMSTLSQLIDQVILLTSMDCIYRAMDDGDERVNNIFQFCQLAATFESNRQGDLERFLEYLDNMENGKGYAINDEGYSGAVRIMSIHKSKGLEFPVVFACALSKRFNDEDIKAPVVCDGELGLGLYCSDQKQRIKYPNVARKAIANKMKAQSFSEEMRVLYVALTRAKDRLIMTYSRQKVEKHIRDLALRMRLSPKELLALDVPSVGDWVLMTAMQRAESKALFSDGTLMENVRSYPDRWHVELIDAINVERDAAEEESSYTQEISSKFVDSISSTLGYIYPHQLATQSPSKQTATQLKGRVKDQEAADGTVKSRKKYYRKPSFVECHKDARTYGNAMHAVMQYIRFDQCGDKNGVRRELQRLLDENFISNAYYDLVNVDAINAFFESELGKKLSASENVVREFKFSILDDGERYVDGLIGEKILLQGVVDCALIEEDGLTIIDFKTDRVTEDSVSGVTSSYVQQIKTYAHAMERIYQRPVKTTALYYFRLGKFVYV